MTFKDHFSGHAELYQAYRPAYPVALYEHLASLAPGRELAWDCATGNGQAAIDLAPFFRSVVATDASPRQIALARHREGVRYEVAPAHDAPLVGASVDLVTVAQALHWFDLPGFYAEVRRVARPGGILAAWCYELLAIGPEVDAVVGRLYDEILGVFWPPERRLVVDGYRTLPFPFEEVPSPPFRIIETWDLGRMMAYIETWSSAQAYRRQTGKGPLDQIRGELGAAWGDPVRGREVTWPLHVRIGRISPVG